MRTDNSGRTDAIGAGPREVLDAVTKLLSLIAERDGYGHDNYDTKHGRLYELARRHKARLPAKLVLRMLDMVEAVFPWTCRKLRGIKPAWDSVGNSYRVGAHLVLHLCGVSGDHVDAARVILDRLRERMVGDPPYRGFGLSFATMMGLEGKLWPTSMPNSHSSVRVARKFLLWERVTGDYTYSEVVDEVARFLTEGLTWGEQDGMTWLGYAPIDASPVVNIWADVASFLASHDNARGADRHRSRVAGLVDSVLAHQEPDGSWPYYGRWCERPQSVDNYHTAMILAALGHLYTAVSSDRQTRVRDSLTRGMGYYLGAFFDDESGKYRCWLEREWPVNPSGMGDALYAFHRLLNPALGLSSDLVNRMRRVADTTVAWGLTHMRTARGRFYTETGRYRRYSLEGVRCWDGLMCDALALHYAGGQLDRERLAILWA